MRIDQIKRTTENKKKRYIGRGGKRGKTSGKGTKGQNSRAGRKKRPELRDIIKKLPKQRGYAFNAFQERPFPITLAMLESHFASGDTVNPRAIAEKKLIKKYQGSMPIIKILGKGELSKKLTITGCAISSGAKAAIEKAGGTVA